MKKENKTKIEKNILRKIEAGEVKMRPRSYFVFRSLLLVLTILLLTLFLIYIGSLIIFVFRTNDIFLLRGMGLKGMRAVFVSFPWYLVFLSVLLISLVQVFGSKYSVIYRRPLIYSFVFILLFSVAGSALIEMSSLNNHFFQRAQKEEMALGGGMYRNLGNIDLSYRYIGIVLEKNNTDIILEENSGNIFEVIISRETRGKRMLYDINEGSKIVVIGEEKNGIIAAHAIKLVNGKGRSER